MGHFATLVLTDSGDIREARHILRSHHGRDIGARWPDIDDDYFHPGGVGVFEGWEEVSSRTRFEGWLGDTNKCKVSELPTDKVFSAVVGPTFLLTCLFEPTPWPGPAFVAARDAILAAHQDKIAVLFDVHI